MSFSAALDPKKRKATKMEILYVGGVFIALSSLLWLLVRGARDAAFPDPILFLTGIAIVAYVVGRWDRAKVPFLLWLGGTVAMTLGRVFAPE